MVGRKRVKSETAPYLVAGLAVASVLMGSLFCLAAEPSSTIIDFRTQIEPIFRQKCSHCHGPDKQESNLRLDQHRSLLEGGDSGEPAVVPGSVESSYLIKILTGALPDLTMPPEGEPLTAEQIERLQQWIEQGARMPTDTREADGSSGRVHWSLQPVAKMTPPEMDDPWISNPIDAFILARLAKQHLSPSPLSDPRNLARRVHLVMHGTPPSSEQSARWQQVDPHNNSAADRFSTA